MFFCYLFLSIVFLFSSCQKKEQNFENQLHLNFQEGDIPSLHPHFLSGHLRGHSIGKLLFEGLTRIDSEGKASLAGAKQVTTSLDGTQYTFSLRENYWSDGSKVTADHYIAAWTHALSPKAECPRADVFYIIKNGQQVKKGELPTKDLGIYALDPMTLVVDLEYPSPYFLQLLAHPIFAPLKTPQEETETFNGPFRIKNWDKGKLIQLVANEHFWNHHLVRLKGIEIECIMDPMTTHYMYEKKQIDWLGDPFGTLPNDVTMQLKETNQALCKPVNRFFWIYLNTHHPLLASSKIRRALSLSVPREQITKHICINGMPLFGSVHSEMIPYSWHENEQEDLLVAKQLFEQGLQELNLGTNYPTLTLSYSHQAGRKQLAEFLKNIWENTFGITVQLLGSEWNVFRHNLGYNNFEIAGCLTSEFCDDPFAFLARFEELKNDNFSQWESDMYKEKIVQIRQKTDGEKRTKLLIDAEKILIEQSPFIPLYRCVHIYAHHPSLTGYVFDGAGCVDFAYASFQ